LAISAIVSVLTTYMRRQKCISSMSLAPVGDAS
jgi:hypothetical protein